MKFKDIKKRILAPQPVHYGLHDILGYLNMQKERGYYKVELSAC